MTATNQTYGNAIGLFRLPGGPSPGPITTIEDNEFDNCQVGLQSVSASLILENNNLINMDHGVVGLQPGSRLIRVINNEIGGAYGVLIYSHTSSARLLEIEDNTITCLPTFSSGGGVGIGINYAIGTAGTVISTTPGSHKIIDNHVTVYDALGRVAWQGYDLPAGRHVLELHDLTPGSYYYEVNSAIGRAKTGKLIILP